MTNSLTPGKFASPGKFFYMEGMVNFNKAEFLGKLGKWISSLRRAKGVGQDKLTEEAGLAKGTVSKIESGTVDAKASTLVRLAMALRVPVSRFFGSRG